MKKTIVAQIVQLNGGSLMAHLSAIKEDAEIDDATTQTLMEFVWQSTPSHAELEALVRLADAGRYISPNPAMPDWGVNDINIWLVPPMAQPGHVCITNENTEYSSDYAHGNPQQFSYPQFYAVMKHWQEFQALIGQKSKENLVGQRFEAVWP
jgi:hypothetical protein